MYLDIGNYVLSKSVLEPDGSQSFQRKEQGHKDTQDTQGHRIHGDYISNFWLDYKICELKQTFK